VASNCVIRITGLVMGLFLSSSAENKNKASSQSTNTIYSV
jgi:hypothetical protein